MDLMLRLAVGGENRYLIVVFDFRGWVSLDSVHGLVQDGWTILLLRVYDSRICTCNSKLPA